MIDEAMTAHLMASILWVPALFLLATAALYMISLSSPPLTPHFHYTNSTDNINQKYTELRFPCSIEDLSDLAFILRRYRTDHIRYLVLLFCCAYLYKQTFAIPGSVFMNMLAGATFGFWYGFPLVCVLTATGATFCFLLSQGFGKYYVLKYIPHKVSFLQTKVAESEDGLFFFLLFVRLIPMSPNWLLNIVSPILNIPIHLFFVSVLIGLMPYNFICVETGEMLSEVSSTNDVFCMSTLMKLSVIALVALLPVVYANRLHPSKQVPEHTTKHAPEYISIERLKTK